VRVFSEREFGTILIGKPINLCGLERDFKKTGCVATNNLIW
jgi:hypothetical protein